MLMRVWKKGIFVHSWWECKLVQPLWKIICRFFKKLKTELPYDPIIALLDIYPKKTKFSFEINKLTHLMSENVSEASLKICIISIVITTHNRTVTLLYLTFLN